METGCSVREVVPQKYIVYTINAKTFQGLGPKRRESSKGDRV